MKKILFLSAQSGLSERNRKGLQHCFNLSNTKSIKVQRKKINLGLIETLNTQKTIRSGFRFTNRWYDNTTLNLNYSFNPFNVVSLFGGISFSDTTFTTYGLSYRAIYEKIIFCQQQSDRLL